VVKLPAFIPIFEQGNAIPDPLQHLPHEPVIIEHFVVFGAASVTSHVDGAAILRIGMKAIRDGNPEPAAWTKELEAVGICLLGLQLCEVLPDVFRKNPPPSNAAANTWRNPFSG
jgi:hypothetical protein